MRRKTLLAVILSLPWAIVSADDAEVLERVEWAYTRNRGLIQTATGRAWVDFDRKALSDPSRERGTTDLVERYECDWWVSGTKRRVDRRPLPLSSEKKRASDGRTTKVFWGPGRKIYFHKWPGSDHPQVVINHGGPGPMEFVRAVPAHFDPMLFLRIDDRTPLEWIDHFRREGYKVSVVKDDATGDFTMEGKGQFGSGAPSGFRIVLSRKCGLSATSMAWFAEGKEDKPFLGFAASYSDWGSDGKIFFPKEYRLEFGTEAREVVTVKFSDVALNPDVSDDVFCVDALGVPVGTPIYDFTRADENNQPHKSRYEGPPSDLNAVLIEGELTEP